MENREWQRQQLARKRAPAVFATPRAFIGGENVPYDRCNRDVDHGAMNETNALRRRAGMAGSLFAGSAVISGAFAAHALRDRLGADALATWHTAVDYQFWHALGLLLVACLPIASKATLGWAMRAFTFGILVFSGSLYSLALGAPRWIGALTPFGGLAFIAGWCCLLIAFARAQSPR